MKTSHAMINGRPHTVGGAALSRRKPGVATIERGSNRLRITPYSATTRSSAIAGVAQLGYESGKRAIR